ncbi:MAG TPA: two-component regulator propeller domain-containing protein, partial [Chitinophagales bacterium]|nr:two-component regulator propeller domain-containing protein [Chitinophagales bacterium]
MQCSGLSATAIIAHPEKIHFVNVSDVLKQQYGINKGAGFMGFDKSGRTWRSVQDSVFVWHDLSHPPERHSFREFAQVHSTKASAFCIDKKNNHLLIVNESGISIVDLSSGNVIAKHSMFIFNPQGFFPFDFDAQGNCWFIAGSIYFLQTGQRRLHVVIADDFGQTVTALFRDRSGIIWLGTNGSGILKMNPGAANFHHVIAKSAFKSINKLTAFHDGSVIVNAYPPFLVKNNNGQEMIQPILPDYLLNRSPINDLIRDTDGTYWCSLGYNRLVHYDAQKKVVLHELEIRRTPEFVNIFPLLFDHLHQLWMGKVENGTASFLHFDKTENRFTDSIVLPLKNISVDAFIRQVYDDGKFFWFITAGGLFRYDLYEKSWKQFVSDPADTATLSNNNLLCICPDEKQPDKVFWIGTDGGGLNRFDITSGKVNRIGAKQGLPNQVVYGILTDSAANLWMSTNKGITCYNPFTKTFKSYVQSDGLQSNEFNRFAF